MIGVLANLITVRGVAILKAVRVLQAVSRLALNGWWLTQIGGWVQCPSAWLLGLAE